MSIWLWLFWGILAGIALVLLICFASALIFRVYWIERRRHLVETARALQPLAREAKKALEVKKRGSV